MQMQMTPLAAVALADGVIPAVDQVLSAILFIALPLLGLVPLVALVAFGGARRNAAGILASGLFALLTGVFLLAAFNASYFAKMDNAYLGNLFLGLWLLALGSVVPFAALAGLGLPWLVAALLAALSLLAAMRAYALGAGLESSYGGTLLLLYLGAALLVLLVFVASLRRAAAWRALVQALAIGGGGVVLLLALYGLGTRDIPLGAAATSPDGPIVKPPVAALFEPIVYPLVFVAVFLLARWWSGRGPRNESRAQSA